MTDVTAERGAMGRDGASWRMQVAGATAGMLSSVVASAAASYYRLSPIDDAYITLRYATRWASGQGLTYNATERVEGYTNFGLLVVEAAAARLSLDPVWAMKAIGLLSLCGLVWTLTVFLGRATDEPPWRMALFSAVVGTSPLLFCWASSGMETCLYSWLILWSASIALFYRGPASIAAASTMTLASLTRPEAVALVPVIALAIHRRRSSSTDLARFIGAFLLAFGSYYAWRCAHFGHPFPLTFYAKLDFGGWPLVTRGALYVWGFVLASVSLWIPALAACVFARRAPRWAPIVAMLLGAQVAIAVFEGGDHFAMYRFMVPAIPFLAMLALEAFLAMSRSFLPPARAGMVGVSAATAMVLASHATLVQAPKSGEPLRQFERFVLECALARDWTRIGRWFRTAVPATASIATVAIGAIGYESQRTIVDPHGLVDPVIAHKKVRLGAGTPGHEKYDVEHSLRVRRPDFLLLYNLSSPEPILERDLPGLVWGDFNRAVLAHPALAESYRYVSFRTDFGYVNCYVLRE